jgi:hypothetical protein
VAAASPLTLHSLFVEYLFPFKYRTSLFFECIKGFGPVFTCQESLVRHSFEVEPYKIDEMLEPQWKSGSYQFQVPGLRSEIWPV